MNGYKNAETFHLSLWMHNNEFVKNKLLPSILSTADGNKIEAGLKLSLIFLKGKNSYSAKIWGKEDYKIMLEDVGNFNVIAWEELFTNCEG